MQGIRRIVYHDIPWRTIAFAGSASFIVTTSTFCSRLDSQDEAKRTRSCTRFPAVHCEAINEEPRSVPRVSIPSFFRRTLATLYIKALPLPRLIVKGDPAFRMDKRLLKRRRDDEKLMQELILGALQRQERDPEKLKELNDKALEIAYGEGMTLKQREDFVQVCA